MSAASALSAESRAPGVFGAPALLVERRLGHDPAQSDPRTP